MSETKRALAPAFADFAEIDPVRCPCGWASRALTDVPGAPVSIHRVEIDHEARVHYHRRQTETYYFLECDGGAEVELDGRSVPVRAGMVVMIPPGVRHRAVGKMTILNVVSPPFDPADEWFDDEDGLA
ncbi:Cupin domain protein [Planctomycetes bacterium Pan216]|uniref:Cupin domain protein n=1 Tax=Kolteria novifilia TaxID=2527975 RepID=A0A518B9Q0_9BACT|nr:Cupin domain protein [Planctomycetes bacterium Pan216]